MDEGDVLAQEETEILPEENAVELLARLAQLGADFLIKTIDRIKSLRPQKQDHSQATYAPKLKKEDGKIDWEKDSRYIQRQVRAFTPWPSAYAFIRKNGSKFQKAGNLKAGLSYPHLQEKS